MILLWKISFHLPKAALNPVSLFLEEEMLAVSWSETKDSDLLLLEAITDQEPGNLNKEGSFSYSINISLQSICASLNIKAPQLLIEEVPERDWLQETYQAFPPIEISPFFIYGSHYTSEPPKDLIPLKIDAATAFGTGEHGTTRGCLEALASLSCLLEAKRILDVGTGSGILAIAAAKLWPEAYILATDNDPEAVRVAHLYMQENKVSIKTLLSEGYQNIKEEAPFDIITANILAGPLCEMAPDLKAALKPTGQAILSGLLTSQISEVVEAHQKAGLKLKEQIIHQEWATLIFIA